MMQSLPVPGVPQLAPYEREVLAEIAAWKNPESTLARETMGRVSKAVDALTDHLRRIPGVDWTMENVAGGLLNLVNEITQDWVWSDAILREFQKRGHAVAASEDLAELPLEHVDKVTAGLSPKYVALAAAEGAATGYAGAAGILPDIVALVALNLRAAGEYATHYGFDTQKDEERLFALHVLNVVASPTDLNKELTLRPVIRVSNGIATRQGLESAGQFAFAKTLKKAVEKLGINLTKAKVAQILPIAGAVVGGAFNTGYTTRVCTASRNLNRERFLVRRYGPVITERDWRSS
jgi:hypothetical protein